MQRDMREHFAPYAGRLPMSRHEHLLGTSGTVTTLAALALGLPRYNRARVDGSWHEVRQTLSSGGAHLPGWMWRRWPG